MWNECIKLALRGFLCIWDTHPYCVVLGIQFREFRGWFRVWPNCHCSCNSWLFQWPGVQVNRGSMKFDPWHPKDTIKQVLQLSDQEESHVGLILKPQLDLVVGWLHGSVISRNFLLVPSGVIYQTFLCSKCISQGFMGEAWVENHRLNYGQRRGCVKGGLWQTYRWYYKQAGITWVSYQEYTGPWTN